MLATEDAKTLEEMEVSLIIINKVVTVSQAKINVIVESLFYLSPLNGDFYLVVSL